MSYDYLTLEEEQLKRDYDLGAVIGRGGFGFVQLAKNKTTGQEFALKMIDKKKFPHMKQEMQILQLLNHPNVVNLFRIYETRHHYGLLMEYLRGGELFDAIVNFFPEGFSERDAALITREIARGLSFLHSKKIVHRDLKPENLLFSRECVDGRINLGTDPQMSLKIIDFGGARDLTGDKKCTDFFGTPNYMAPEMTLNQSYGLEVDCWAMGVLVYILLCGYDPWIQLEDDLSNLQELFQNIRAGRIQFPAEDWDEISTDAKDMILGLLQSDPKKRLSCDQVLTHQWMIKLVNNKVPNKRLSVQTRLTLNFRGKKKFRAAADAVIASQRLTARLNGFGAMRFALDARRGSCPPRVGPLNIQGSAPAVLNGVRGGVGGVGGASGVGALGVSASGAGIHAGNVSQMDALAKAGAKTRKVLLTFKGTMKNNHIRVEQFVRVIDRYRDVLKNVAAFKKGVVVSQVGDRSVVYLDNATFLYIMNGARWPQVTLDMINSLFDTMKVLPLNMVDFSEVCLYLTTILDENFDGKLRGAFRLYDINGDGELSMAEIEQMFLRLLPSCYLDPDFEMSCRFFDVVTEAFCDMDKNGDGSVTFEEFLSYTSQNPPFRDLMQYLFEFGLPDTTTDGSRSATAIDEKSVSSRDWTDRMQRYLKEMEDKAVVRQTERLSMSDSPTGAAPKSRVAELMRSK